MTSEVAGTTSRWQTFLSPVSVASVPSCHKEDRLTVTGRDLRPAKHTRRRVQRPSPHKNFHRRPALQRGSPLPLRSSTNIPDTQLRLETPPPTRAPTPQALGLLRSPLPAASQRPDHRRRELHRQGPPPRRQPTAPVGNRPAPLVGAGPDPRPAERAGARDRDDRPAPGLFHASGPGHQPRHGRKPREHGRAHTQLRARAACLRGVGHGRPRGVAVPVVAAG